jgi:hypothetical protein
MGGHNVPESVDSLLRNGWTVSNEMGGHYAAEYALHRRAFLFDYRSKIGFIKKTPIVMLKVL